MSVKKPSLSVDSGLVPVWCWVDRGQRVWSWTLWTWNQNKQPEDSGALCRAEGHCRASDQQHPSHYTESEHAITMLIQILIRAALTIRLMGHIQCSRSQLPQTQSLYETRKQRHERRHFLICFTMNIIFARIQKSFTTPLKKMTAQIHLTDNSCDVYQVAQRFINFTSEDIYRWKETNGGMSESVWTRPHSPESENTWSPRLSV